MQTITVYHVVTEQPMELGQKILFDENHLNGVARRVMTFQNILRKEPIRGELVDSIRSDLEKWAKVAYRELALEAVRQAEFPEYPSRLACLYTSRTFDEAQSWAQFFMDIGRRVYSIVKLRVNGNLFDGDACLCFDGTKEEKENLEKARHYWKKDIQTERPVIETLVDGELVVEEITRPF